MPEEFIVMLWFVTITLAIINTITGFLVGGGCLLRVLDYYCGGPFEGFYSPQTLLKLSLLALCWVFIGVAIFFYTEFYTAATIFLAFMSPAYIAGFMLKHTPGAKSRVHRSYHFYEEK